MVNFDDVLRALELTIQYQKSMNEIFTNGRGINLPQEITENLILSIIRHIKGMDARWCKDTKKPHKISGDGYTQATGIVVKLEPNKRKAKVVIQYTGMKRLEFKCFTSNGPPTFGPTEKWDRLYFLDAIDYHDYKFKLYEVPLSNVSDEWKSLKVNKSQTFEDQAEQGRRPRLVFHEIQTQLGEHCKMIWEGDIRNLYN
tara:strand:+ start:6735 stop:7331 length:597 start_codon:yes stop_codon:yes gene_type:complete